MNVVNKGPWYVVFVGASPGIYRSYKEASRYTQGYPKQEIRKFKTKQAAEAEFNKRSRSDYDPKKEFKWSYQRPVRR